MAEIESWPSCKTHPHVLMGGVEQACFICDEIKAAVEAEMERAAKILDELSRRYGSLAEGQNDPEFGQLIFAEEACRSAAAKIRRAPEPADD